MTPVEQVIAALSGLVDGRCYASFHDVPDDAVSPYVVVHDQVAQVPAVRGDRTTNVWADTMRVAIWQRLDQFDDLLANQCLQVLLDARVQGPAGRIVPFMLTRVDDPDEPWTQQVITLTVPRAV